MRVGSSAAARISVSSALHVPAGAGRRVGTGQGHVFYLHCSSRLVIWCGSVSSAATVCRRIP